MAQTAGGKSHPDNPFADPQDIDSVFKRAPEGFKKYNMYYTTSRLDVRLHLGPSTTPAIYYAESRLRLGSPQLLLRRGDAKTAPTTNFAKFRLTSRHILLGKGDYTNQSSDQIAWEELHREKNLMRRSDYHFGTTEGSATGERATFTWHKDMGKTLKTVYDCVEDGGRVVARLLSGGALNARKGGEIDVIEGLDQGLEEYLIMSAVAIWAMEALDYQSLLQGFESSSEKNE